MIYNDKFIKIKWQPINSFDNLCHHREFVFKVNCNKYYDSIKEIYHEILSTEEIIKSKKFRQAADSKRFICSRYILRKILSALLGVVAQDILIELGENEKPRVNGIEFNVSHSGDMILVAISQNPIGIDVEEIIPLFDFNSITESSFTYQELAYVNNSFAKDVSFYEIWTRKEALLKATGEGLVDDMNTIGALANEVFRFDKGYHLISFRINENYMACLASLNVNEFVFFEYQ